MIIIRRVVNRNQYTNHLTAQFGFYDWLGRKGGDVLEWQINNFEKRRPEYYSVQERCFPVEGELKMVR